MNVNVMAKPNFLPYVCLQCGVGDDRRKWYASIQLNIEFYFQPVNNAAIFLCNECWDSLVTSVTKQAQEFMFGTEQWSTGEFVEPTYDNEKELTIGEQSGFKPGTIRFGSNVKADSGSSESNDPAPIITVSQPEPNDPDDESQQLRTFLESGTGT